MVYKALYSVIAGNWTHFNNGYWEKMTSPISQCYVKEGTRNQRWKSHLSTRDIARICLEDEQREARVKILVQESWSRIWSSTEKSAPGQNSVWYKTREPQQSSQVDDTASEGWKNTGSPTTARHLGFLSKSLHSPGHSGPFLAVTHADEMKWVQKSWMQY